ncbi:hypothetical protein IT398_02635 [Candidatus Nomurabacteria bacterium]|nr:hypothetical protein [Candidatus Nomurabacteria bacterium]
MKEEFSHERLGAKFIFLFALGIIFAVTMTTEVQKLNSSAGLTIFLAVIIVLMSKLISGGATHSEKASAKGFAKALETFSGHSSIGLCNMSSASRKDLVS